MLLLVLLFFNSVLEYMYTMQVPQKKMCCSAWIPCMHVPRIKMNHAGNVMLPSCVQLLYTCTCCTNMHAYRERCPLIGKEIVSLGWGRKYWIVYPVWIQNHNNLIVTTMHALIVTVNLRCTKLCLVSCTLQFSVNPNNSTCVSSSRNIQEQL